LYAVKKLNLNDTIFKSDCDDLILTLGKPRCRHLDHSDTKIEVISLDYTNMGHSHIDHFVQSFTHVKNLKEIHIKGQNLVSISKLFGKAFLGCKHLEFLDITDNNIKLTDQRCHDAIQDLIVNTRRLRVLVMNDCIINEEESRNYLDALHMNSTIVQMKFQNSNDLTNMTLRRFETEIQMNTLIDALILPSFDYEHPSQLDMSKKLVSSLEHVVKYLKCHPNIMDIDLSHNSLNDSHMKVLTEYITQKKRKLHGINLSYNHIGNEGAKEIIDLFNKDAEISNIDLSHNNIGSENFKTMMHSLRTNLVVRKLYLNE